MQTIIYCPVCGTNIRSRKICPDCGYDAARDYDIYPTLIPITEGMSSVRAKRQKQEKQRLQDVIDELLASLRSEMRGQAEELKLVKQQVAELNQKLLRMEAREIISPGTISESPSTLQPKKALITIKDNTCTFGSYPQDANGSVRPIQWKVLEVDQNNHKALLISKYVLDCQPYNTTETDVTWETCSLRGWLNSTFLKAAFTGEEQAIIQRVTVSADKNPGYNTNQGNSTADQVFLLSISELLQYFKSKTERMCVPTAYAIEQGSFTNDKYKLDNRATCDWWLRSLGASGSYASNVFDDGSVYAHGSSVNFAHVGVRPALWVDLESVIR